MEVGTPKDVSVFDPAVMGYPVPETPRLVVMSISTKVIQRKPSSELVAIRCVSERGGKLVL